VPSSGNIATYIESLEYLLSNKDWNMALRTFSHAYEKAKTLHQFAALAKSLQQVPVALRCQKEWINISLQIACNGREPQLILEMQPHFDQSLQQRNAAYLAWAYRKFERYTEALKTLSDLENVLNPGLAWRIHGECLAALQQDGWHESFAKASQLLTGRSLGICHMEYGSWCFLRHELTQAQTQYNQAYAILKHDAHYGAWIKYNLGLVTLELGLPEAEQHFYTVQDLSNRVDAKVFCSRAWSGIGAVRRSQGQWNRAIFAYERGLQYVNAENDADDRIAAMCGLGHTFRCAGQLNEALEVLWESLDYADETDKIRVLIAATLLQRGAIQESQNQLKLLEKQPKNGETGMRFAILCAELARIEGQTVQALQHLQEINPKRLCVREERRCFPELFSFAEQHGWLSPHLPAVVPLTVNVRALGVLEVRINQQAIHLKSSSKIAELLVFLLEQHGHASSESIAEALYPEKNNARRTSQALWALAKQLREALGWDDSLQDKGKAYALGQDGVIWDYDAAKQKNKSRLLEGVYSNWVQNIRENLD
jgi:hypothetical protein